jgi:hypothetical protein
MVKNFINLVLPGTPYTDAYAPSSQLFSSVIQHLDLGGEFNRENLINKFNTQAYTIFGVGMILFGIFSPVFIFVWFTFLSFVYRLFDNIFIKAGLLYLFLGALASYAFETIMANAMHLVISMFFMYLVIYIIEYAMSRYHAYA